MTQILDSYDNRLERTVDQVIQFARGNFNVRQEITEEDDNLNTITAGLNMLGDELAQYKNELDERSQFLEDILNNVGQIIYVLEVDAGSISNIGRYKFISSQVKGILGHNVADIKNDRSVMISSIYPADTKIVENAIQTGVLKGETVSFSCRMIHKTTKELVWLESTIVPKKNAKGEVYQIFGSAKDITERKKAEEMLIEQKKFTEHILNSLPAEITVLDQDYRYSFINPNAVKDKKIRHHLIGKNDNDYCKHHGLSGDVADERRSKFAKAKETRRQVEWLDEHLDSNGIKRWTLRKLYPIFEKNMFKYAISYGTDITVLKSGSEEREKLIKELNKKINEMMQFNYIVSHNLRAPVASILGLTNILQTPLPEKDKIKIYQYIQKAMESMDETIKDLNNILASRSPLNEKIESFRMTEIINEVKNNLLPQINKSQTSINLQIEPGADNINSIKSYIQSVMFNLISNSIKYKSPNRSPVINIKLGKTNKGTNITISDNGMGIDLKKYKDQVFGLYKRFHLHSEGKGLGLHMSKAQIESLGGNIKIESILNTGTTFKISLI